MSDTPHALTPVASFLPTLMRELAHAPTVGSAFAPILAGNRACAHAPTGRPCEHCCHWSLPLHAPYIGRSLPEGVAMLYHEWIAWHLHVVTHQGGVLVS